MDRPNEELADFHSTAVAATGAGTRCHGYALHVPTALPSSRAGRIGPGSELRRSSKMVTKRNCSEYTKKFKHPKQETYTKCYEEMQTYRASRRLREHAHNPWFWDTSDSDSESEGRSPLTRVQRERERLGPLLGESGSAGTNFLPDGDRRAPEEKQVGSRCITHAAVPHGDPETDPGGPQQPQSKPPKHSKQTPLQHRKHIKDRKHPFALYGSGVRYADISDKKTHNVGPAASTTEIHKSALRAKTRREAERQRREHQGAQSADSDDVGEQPENDPWLTEYMRCFSAHS